MAEVEKAVQSTSDAGVVPTKNGSLSTSDEYLFLNDGNTILIVENGGAEATDVTITTPGTEGGLAIEDRKVTVANATEKVIGPFSKRRYNDDAEKIHVKLSKVTSVTVQALSLGA